jgi:hypothetical protein
VLFGGSILGEINLPDMQSICIQCKKTFTHSKEDLDFYKKFEVDPRDICFDCGQKQQLCFRNERVLYNRKCDATGENIVSIYAPESPYKVYKKDYWISDKWDAIKYGRPFDFTKTFFEQFKQLQLDVPRTSLVNVSPENSDYCNMCAYNKNCYLVFGGDFNEDCMYGTLCMHNSDSLDIDYSNENELTYMMDNSMNCYGSRFVWDSKSCVNCAFVTDCIGCKDCMFCSNLKNKSYCMDNVQLSKEEYQKRQTELLTGGYKKQLKNWQKFLKLRENRITKYGHILSCENSTGDYLKNCKNCHNVFDVSNSEDVRNGIYAEKAKDCFNISLVGHDSELAFCSISIMAVSNVKYSYYVFDSADVDYSEQITGSQNLFGCEGLHHKKYCILNKQYSKEEYENLRAKIIEHMKKTGEWGKFLPQNLSCFGYNESTAMRYYPLTKERALAEGFKWRDEDIKVYKAQTYQIPDNIKDVPESITEETLACESCKKNFRVIAKELEFYKKQNIPVPHNCAECRHKERFALRNSYKLYDRKCAKCKADIQTTYAPNRHEIVYCESCYLKEIY